MHAAGIVKIPFDELPPEMRTKYGYNAQAAAAFRRQSNQAAVERERAIAEAKEKQRLFNLSGTTAATSGGSRPAPPSPKPQKPAARIAKFSCCSCPW